MSLPVDMDGGRPAIQARKYVQLCGFRDIS